MTHATNASIEQGEPQIALGMNAEAPASTPVLEAVNVDVVYGEFYALVAANLSVAPGEWVAVTGPSGSGKSTLLQLFAAVDQPTRGSVRFQGVDLANRRHLDRYRRIEVGHVFQLHNLLPHLDAKRNIEIAMFGTHRGRQARSDHATELLSLFELTAQAGHKPPEMSGGERQRVAIARALANNPAVILADEPTGSLDPEGAAKIITVFDRLHRTEGTTIVMVTHDREIASAADRVIQLEGGRIT